MRFGRARWLVLRMLVADLLLLTACQSPEPKAGAGAGTDGSTTDQPVTESVRRLIDTAVIRTERQNADVIAAVQLVQPFALRSGGQRDVFARTNAYQSALIHFRDAAAHGNSVAAACAGIIDIEGGAQATDFSDAAKLFQQAVDRGYGLAGFDLGILYQRGDGVPMDADKAAQLQSIAAGQGHPSALLMVDSYALMSVTQIVPDAAGRTGAGGQWTRPQLDQTLSRVKRQMDDMLNDFNMMPELIPCMVPAGTDPQEWLLDHESYLGANPPTDVLLYQVKEAVHHLDTL